MRPLLSIFLLGVSLAACKAPRPLPGVTVSADVLREKEPGQAEVASALGPGDVLDVRVFEEEHLSGGFRISPEGTIDYPLCGKVSLGGKTSSQAADELTRCLSRYLRHPQVSVLIREVNSKKVFVFGEVNRPGTFTYEDNMSIIQAITLAGGFTKVASKNNTNVTRLVDGQEVKVRVPVEDIGVGREKNFLLLPGDIVFVPESFF